MRPPTRTLGTCKSFYPIPTPLFTPRTHEHTSSFTLAEWIDLSAKSIHSLLRSLSAPPVFPAPTHAKHTSVQPRSCRGNQWERHHNRPSRSIAVANQPWNPQHHAWSRVHTSAIDPQCRSPYAPTARDPLDTRNGLSWKTSTMPHTRRHHAMTASCIGHTGSYARASASQQAATA